MDLSGNGLSVDTCLVLGEVRAPLFPAPVSPLSSPLLPLILLDDARRALPGIRWCSYLWCYWCCWCYWCAYLWCYWCAWTDQVPGLP